MKREAAQTTLSAILHDIETSVLNETNNLLVNVFKVPYNRPQDGKRNEKQIVDILALELRAFIDKMKICEEDYKELKRTYTSRWQQEVEIQMQEFRRTTNVQETRTQLNNKVMEISELDAKYGKLAAAYQTRGEEFDSAKRRNVELMRAHQTTENSLRQTLLSEKNRQEDFLAATNPRFIEDIQAANAKSDSLQSQLDLEEATHKKQTARLLQDHATMISKMMNEHRDVKKQLEAQISQLEEDHAAKQDDMRKVFEASKLSWQKQLAQTKNSLKDEHEKTPKRIEKLHVEEKERLRKDVNEYSTALLTRDDFKQTPDDEIKAKFLGLVQEVDALARLEWKVDQSEHPGQVLQSLSQTQRTLKKQLLQDESLESRVQNCMINGAKNMDIQQVRILIISFHTTDTESQVAPKGNDSHHPWPVPSMEAERWRHVTVKECRSALREPASQWDPRAILKKDFKASLDALRKECSLMLEKVSTLDRRSIQAMEKLTMKAANMWLEFGMQRCRILVAVQGSNLKSAQDKIKQAQTGTLVMALRPEVRRIGNSKGLDLTVEEIVGGCEGETVEASMK